MWKTLLYFNKECISVILKLKHGQLIKWLISTTCFIRFLPETFRRIFQKVVQHITILPLLATLRMWHLVMLTCVLTKEPILMSRWTREMQRRTIGERMVIDGAKMEIRYRSLNVDPSTKLQSF